MTEEELLTRNYLSQAGSGMGNFYLGPIYQRGYGIGSFLGGLFRNLLPLLKRGSIAIGMEVLNSGTNFINDIENNLSPGVAFNTRSREAYDNLKRKAMHGEGYITGKNHRKRQLSSGSRTVRIKRRKILKKKKPVQKKKKKTTLKKKIKDIFSK